MGSETGLHLESKAKAQNLNQATLTDEQEITYGQHSTLTINLNYV